MSKPTIQIPKYQYLVVRISDTYIKGVNNAYKAVNTELLQTNLETGQYIVEFEQKGKIKATKSYLLDSFS